MDRVLQGDGSDRRLKTTEKALLAGGNALGERWTSCWLEEEEGGAGWNFLGAVDQRAGRPGRRNQAPCWLPWSRGRAHGVSSRGVHCRGWSSRPWSREGARLLDWSPWIAEGGAMVGAEVPAPMEKPQHAGEQQGKKEARPWMLEVLGLGGSREKEQASMGKKGGRPWEGDDVGCAPCLLPCRRNGGAAA
jgi:hypothetical protein